jgi:hypothetical protein
MAFVPSEADLGQVLSLFRENITSANAYNRLAKATLCQFRFIWAVFVFSHTTGRGKRICFAYHDAPFVGNVALDRPMKDKVSQHTFQLIHVHRHVIESQSGQEHRQINLVLVFLFEGDAVFEHFSEKIAVQKGLELLENQENTLLDEEILVFVQT